LRIGRCRQGPHPPRHVQDLELPRDTAPPHGTYRPHARTGKHAAPALATHAPSLLRSQLAALAPPAPEVDAVRVDVASPAQHGVEKVIAVLQG